MRSATILQLIGALGVVASPVADAGDHDMLERRKTNAYPTCTSPVLRVIDAALTIIGPKATTFCSSYLKATTVTVSVTSSVTAHATITTTVGSTVLTVTSGIVSATEVQTATVVNTVTPPTVTKTITTPILENRGYKPPPYTPPPPPPPYTPPPLGGIATSIASKACSCFLGPSKSVTVTKTTTISLTDVATVPATIYTTIPSSTTTVTQVETKTNVVSLPAPTETMFVAGKSYTRAYGPANGCVYNEYTDYIDLHGDIGSASDSFLAGRAQCAKRCNDSASCLWFFFYVDLEGASMGYPAWCLLDNVRYQSQFVQCSIPWSGYNVGYNLVA